MFDERRPLKILDKIEARITMLLRKDRQIVASWKVRCLSHFAVFLTDLQPVCRSLQSKLSMGDLWKQNVQRIIKNKNKELPAFPNIQRCQQHLRRRHFGTPACYQAWKDINALSQVESQVRISPKVSRPHL